MTIKAEWLARLAAAFSRGFDHGNYGSACESEDWGAWSDDQSPPAEYGQEEGHAWLVGVLCGFWSSHEDHEVPEEWRDEVCRLRSADDTRQLADAAGVALD